MRDIFPEEESIFGNEGNALMLNELLRTTGRGRNSSTREIKRPPLEPLEEDIKDEKNDKSEDMKTELKKIGKVKSFSIPLEKRLRLVDSQIIEEDINDNDDEELENGFPKPLNR